MKWLTFLVLLSFWPSNGLVVNSAILEIIVGEDSMSFGFTHFVIDLFSPYNRLIHFHGLLLLFLLRWSSKFA